MSADAENARALREALRELLRANNGVEIDRDRASATLDEAARRAGLAVRFEAGAIRFRPTRSGVAGGLAIVLAAVGEAMADGSWRRLKACRSEYVPLCVHRQGAEPVAAVVLDAGLRQPREGPHLPARHA